MSIKNLEIEYSPEYYNAEFVKYIEDHLPYFMTPSRTTVRQIDAAIAYKHEGDFYGLLSHLRVANGLHYLTMRINGYTNPLQYDGQRHSIVLYSGGDETAIAKALSTKVR